MSMNAVDMHANKMHVATLLFRTPYHMAIQRDCSEGTVEPLNKGHFGDNKNSADLFFVERFSL